MSDLIKSVRSYRLAPNLDERMRHGEKIFNIVEPALRAFVLSKVSPDAALDALQEVLRGVAVSLTLFKGDSDPEFWGWCYRIARNKISDHYRHKAIERVQPVPPEELAAMMDVSFQKTPATAAIRHDLAHAMKLLTNSKPECYDFLWKHFVVGLDYGELAEEKGMSYDNARMKVGRCLDEARSLVS